MTIKELRNRCKQQLDTSVAWDNLAQAAIDVCGYANQLGWEAERNGVESAPDSEMRRRQEEYSDRLNVLLNTCLQHGIAYPRTIRPRDVYRVVAT